MKKLTLILCCLAFIVSGVAQPQKAEGKKEKAIFYLKQAVWQEMQASKQSQKSEEWWEPDTIYQYYGDGNTNEIRRIFSYANEKCTGEIWQTWNMNQWRTHGRVAHTYDTQNNKTETLFQYWQDNQWYNDMRTLYKYDVKNNMIEERLQEWEGYWDDLYLKKYEYDNLNRMTVKVIFYEWDEAIKIIYKYDEQNNRMEETHQYFIDEDEWYDNMIIVYSYDVQNRLTGAMLQILDDVWEESIKLTVVYDLQNNTTTHIYDFRDWENGQWFGVMKIIYTYDSQNNLLTESLQEWEDGDEWEEYERYTYSYDENNNAKDGYYFPSYKKGFLWDWDEEFELTVHYNNMQSKISTYQYNRFKATYLKPSELGIKESILLNSSINLYPNPVSSILNIETNSLGNLPEVKIYSVQGVLLIQAKGCQIDVSSLPSGVYIANINGVSKKIVKQ